MLKAAQHFRDVWSLSSSCPAVKLSNGFCIEPNTCCGKSRQSHALMAVLKCRKSDAGCVYKPQGAVLQ